MGSFSEIANTILNYYSYILNFFLISVYIGIGVTKPLWLSMIDYYLKMLISVFLIIRFNPFRKIVFEDLDRNIAFTAGMILFSSTTLKFILMTYDATINKYIKRITQ